MSAEAASGEYVFNVLIVDDHEMTKIGLTFALNAKGTVNIVGEASDGLQAIQMSIEKKPDIVLMDVFMPLMNGIEATQEIKRQLPDTKIVMLTSHQEIDTVYASFAAGADAYCSKEIRIERLLQVLEMVWDGAAWLDPAIAKIVLNGLHHPVPAEKLNPQGASRQRYNDELTERETEVLALIVDGLSNKRIAEALSITTHTVKAHVCSIIHKLSVDDRTQAAIKALRDGLIVEKI